ncbi:MAG: hypothetical protein WBO54_12705, partial [Thermoanaerobaculia bacterium]
MWCALATLGLLAVQGSAAAELELETPVTQLTGLPFALTVRVIDAGDAELIPLETFIDGQSVDRRTLSAGEHEIVLDHIDLSSGSH